MLDSAGDVDTVYVEEILPQKMKWNLESVRNFSLLAELRTMVKTVMAVLR